jgi:hypothetical protein
MHAVTTFREATSSIELHPRTYAPTIYHNILFKSKDPQAAVEVEACINISNPAFLALVFSPPAATY